MRQPHGPSRYRVLLGGAGALLLAVQFAAGQEQVTELKASHRAGQTFLTWKEVEPSPATDDMSPLALRNLAYKCALDGKTLYRIYRSDKPIKSLHGLKPIAEAPPLTCWNIHFYGIYPDKRRKQGEKNLRYVVEPGQEPLQAGKGVHVHNPEVPEGKSVRAYYAVAAVVGAKENTTVGPGNVLADPVEESAGQGVPVLQRTVRNVKFNYVDGATLHYYVRWEAPPNASVGSNPFNYLVAIPPNVKYPSPAGIHFHCWGNHLRGGYGSWTHGRQGAILIAPNQVPYDWWTGYHERLRPSFHLSMPKPRDKEVWLKGVVRPYTQNRILSFFDWACTKWRIDVTRVFTAGNSMGGAGSLMFAIRHGDRIAWCRSQVGVHVPAHSPHFRSSYERVYGRVNFGVKFEDGNSVWDHFSDDWYLRKYPKREVGYLVFANGKNDHGIGWPQSLEFLRALQDTKRPHLFVWQMRGHGSSPSFPNPAGARRVGGLPIDVRTDLSLPAFTQCDLDDDPGTGKALPEPKPWKKNPRGKMLTDRYDGDPEGQVNLYLYWDTKDIVDQPGRWEMTVGLTPAAPKDRCTVNITPRRCQKFHPAPGVKLQWTNTFLKDGKEVASGTVTVDKWGLVTLKGLSVGKGRNRIRITGK